MRTCSIVVTILVACAAINAAEPATRLSIEDQIAGLQKAVEALTAKVQAQQVEIDALRGGIVNKRFTTVPWCGEKGNERIGAVNLDHILSLGRIPFQGHKNVACIGWSDYSRSRKILRLNFYDAVKLFNGEARLSDLPVLRTRLITNNRGRVSR